MNLLPAGLQSYIKERFGKIAAYLDKQVLQGLEPHQVGLLTAVSLFLLIHLLWVTRSFLKLITDPAKVKTKLFRLACFIPQVQEKIEKEHSKMMKECTAKYSKLRQNAKTILPENGTSTEEILATVKSFA